MEYQRTLDEYLANMARSDQYPPQQQHFQPPSSQYQQQNYYEPPPAPYATQQPQPPIPPNQRQRIQVSTNLINLVDKI